MLINDLGVTFGKANLRNENKSGSANVQLHSGTGRITASTTQQWPKQKTLRATVERTGSMWLPRPKTCGPLRGDSVSSMAIRIGVMGEVSRPGFYLVAPTSQVEDAVMAAAGATQNARKPSSLISASWIPFRAENTPSTANGVSLGWPT